MPSNQRAESGLKLATAAMFLVLLGARLWLVASNGHAMPFEDEWDAGAGGLYGPYISGTLGWQQLLAPFNEHRFLTSRLLGLVEFELAGGWNTIFQMMVSSVIAAATFTWIAATISTVVRPTYRLLFLAVCTFVFSLPIGFESLTMGMNAHFYLFIALSIAGLSLVTRRRGLSAAWWAGVCAMILAYLSLASATATPLVALCVVALQVMTGTRKTDGRELIAAVLLAAASGAMLYFIPRTPSDDVYHAHSVWEFLVALSAISAAPLLTPVGTAIVHTPTVLMVVRLIRSRPEQNSAAWIVVAIAGWVAAQMVLIALSRASSPLSSRYLDIIMMVFPVAVAGLLTLDGSSRLLKACATAWLFAVISLLGFEGMLSSLRRAESRYDRLKGTAPVITAFLRDGDPTAIASGAGKVFYPRADVLLHYLSDPIVRRLVPAEFQPSPELALDPKTLALKGIAKPVIDALVALRAALAYLCLSLGAGLFFVVSRAAAIRAGETQVDVAPVPRD